MYYVQPWDGVLWSSTDLVNWKNYSIPFVHSVIEFQGNAIIAASSFSNPQWVFQISS